VGGHYFWNLFPALLLSGVGLAFSFVPVTIAGLTGVRAQDAGVASGLINASRQVGGAIGLAAVTTIAANYTVAGGGPAAVDGGLTQGYQVGFLALTAMALAGAVIAALLLGPQPQEAAVERLDREHANLEEAA
jgi:hypothetical protein